MRRCLSLPIYTYLFALSFRTGKAVKEIISIGYNDFPICPRCKSTIDVEYVYFCEHCGQKLNWNSFDNAVIIK